MFYTKVMDNVRYRLKPGDKITDEEREMLRKAQEKQDQLLAEGRYDEVYDDDCPSTDPDQNPKLYAAFEKAAEERNRRLAKLARKRA